MDVTRSPFEDSVGSYPSTAPWNRQFVGSVRGVSPALTQELPHRLVGSEGPIWDFCRSDTKREDYTQSPFETATVLEGSQVRPTSRNRNPSPDFEVPQVLSGSLLRSGPRTAPRAGVRRDRTSLRPSQRSGRVRPVRCQWSSQDERDRTKGSSDPLRLTEKEGETTLSGKNVRKRPWQGDGGSTPCVKSHGGNRQST